MEENIIPLFELYSTTTITGRPIQGITHVRTRALCTILVAHDGKMNLIA
jgi:hypothetical protein